MRSDPRSSERVLVESGAPQPSAAVAVETVLKLVEGTRIEDFEIEWEGIAVRVKREPSPIRLAPGHPPPTIPMDEEPTVTSAFVGTFRRDSSTDLPDVGESVAAGQTLAFVDTLGMQNAVIAPFAGVLASILVDDGTPVEYGQPLFTIHSDGGPGEADG